MTWARWKRRALARFVLLFALLAPLAASAQTGLQSRGTQPDVAQVASPEPRAGGDSPSATGLELPEVPVEFSTYHGDWISIAYHPSLSARVGLLKKNADLIKAELTQLLGQPVLARVHVRIGRDVKEMARLTPAGSDFPRYASGLAYAELGLVLLAAEPRYPGETLDLLEVFKHELSHIALHDAVGRQSVPRWFNEGLAIHASGEAFTARLQTLWTATLAKTLLPLSQLTRSFPADATAASIAYAQAADLVRFLLKGDQDVRFRALLERVRNGQSFDDALADSYSTDVANLESEWQTDVARRYSFWPILLSGSTLWAGALVLFFWGYMRRKRRAKLKLARWAKEEAAEDARRVLAQTTLGQAGALHFVLASTAARMAPVGAEQQDTTQSAGPQVRPGSVPQIEHEGGWHTLH